MEIKLRAFISIFTVIKYKLMYAGKFKASFLQSFGKRMAVYVSGKKSLIEIGARLVTRENVILRSQNGKLIIGERCFINSNTSITCIDSIRIGDNCQFGQNVVIVDHDHDYKGKTGSALVSTPVTIGDGVWIGANCVILRGTSIGNGAVIAAGSVVKGEIPPGHMVYQKRENVVKPID